jgi:hypothetical protein
VAFTIDFDMCDASRREFLVGDRQCQMPVIQHDPKKVMCVIRATSVEPALTAIKMSSIDALPNTYQGAVVPCRIGQVNH